MGAKNKVIAGDYEGKNIGVGNNCAYISLKFLEDLCITNNTVESYEVIDQNYTKSASSAIGRGLVGSFFLGPVGLLAGLSAKTKGIYMVAIQFKDGKKSLLEVDDKIYKAIITKCFNR